MWGRVGNWWAGGWWGLGGVMLPPTGDTRIEGRGYIHLHKGEKFFFIIQVRLGIKTVDMTHINLRYCVDVQRKLVVNLYNMYRAV